MSVTWYADTIIDDMHQQIMTLSDINYEAFDPRWSEYEWSDEGPSGGGTPDQYD